MTGAVPSTISTTLRDLRELIVDASACPSEWNGKVIICDDNMSYLVWNEKTLEALFVDSCIEDVPEVEKFLKANPKLKIIAVVDTHTHADHISAGAQWSEKLGVPWIMHAQSHTQRAQVRIAKDTPLFTHAGPARFLTTPGHTPDGLAIFWGPFLFTGDTIFYADTGRDDLPGGDPATHYASLQKIKAHAKPENLMLPAHDNGGGRISSWKTQLEVNAALSQPAEIFIPEAAAYIAKAPRLFKESLYENLK